MRRHGPSAGTLKKSFATGECYHPCVYQYGSCSFGEECKFALVDGRICAKFLKGKCSWGDQCCWRHPHELPREVRPGPQQRSGRPVDGPGPPQAQLQRLPEAAPDYDVLRQRWRQQQHPLPAAMQQQPPTQLLIRDMRHAPPPAQQLDPQGGMGLPQALLGPPPGRSLAADLAPPPPLGAGLGAAGLGLGAGDGPAARGDAIAGAQQLLSAAAGRLESVDRFSGDRVDRLDSLVAAAELAADVDAKVQEQHIARVAAMIAALRQQCATLGLAGLGAPPATPEQPPPPPPPQQQPQHELPGAAAVTNGTDAPAAAAPSPAAAASTAPPDPATIEQQQDAQGAPPADAAGAAAGGGAAANTPNACGRCGVTGPDLKLCGGCRRVAFCGIECQRTAWPDHGPVCIKIQEQRKARHERGQLERPAGHTV